jgi:DNA-binding winged helix-turn-helix (wHTH) protein
MSAVQWRELRDGALLRLWGFLGNGLDSRGAAVSLRFGDCLFDADSRQLHRAGQPVALTPKAFQLLEMLLGRRPNAVSKAEIYERLWPSTFVAEVNLSRLIFEIRAGLGDDAQRPRYLRTVRGYGYAFSGEVSEARGRSAAPLPAGPWYALFEGDREIPLHEGENVLGRSRRDDVVIGSTGVSRRHARLVIGPEGATVQDLGSKNGTFVNGQRTDATVPLVDGDTLRLGTVTMTFRMIQPEAPTSTRRPQA